MLWVPLLFYYGAIPLLDIAIGEDRSNPPEAIVPQLEDDRYYRYITYALVPILWALYLFAMWFVATQPLPPHGVLAMVLVASGVFGYGINVAHEFGRKKTGHERWLAKFVLALCAYGHFFIEHNKGHHRDVATPEDPASARMGESIWKFACREMSGAAKRVLRHVSGRLFPAVVVRHHGQASPRTGVPRPGADQF